MPEMCSTPECKNEARAAIRTTEKGVSTVYYDNRTAPSATAARYCKGHAVATIASLALDLIDEDD